MRTAESFPIQVQRINNGATICAPRPDSAWENRSLFDPACVFVSSPEELKILVAKLPFDDGIRSTLLQLPAIVVCIYAAEGTDPETGSATTSRLGLAVFSPVLELIARHSEPVIQPDMEFDAAGISAPRISKVGRRYVLTYNARGAGAEPGDIRIAYASTTDFTTWVKHGVLRGNFNEDASSDGVMFEKKVGTKFIMLHQLISGPDAGSIHWAESTDVYREWKNRGLLMRSLRGTAPGTIHAAAPPVKLSDGRFIVLYRIRRNAGFPPDSIGLALGDPGSRYFIVKRDESVEFSEISHAESPASASHPFSICGAYLFDDTLYFPWSDERHSIFGAAIASDQIARFIGR